MESFLGIEWKNYGNCAKLVPEDFIFGSFIQGLNDPVHHKEFGLFFTNFQLANIALLLIFVQILCVTDLNYISHALIMHILLIDS